MSNEKERLPGGDRQRGNTKGCNTKIAFGGYKPRLCLMYSKLMDALNRRLNVHGRNGLLNYPDCYSVFSHFHFSKDESRELFDELVEMGLIRLVPYRGVEIRGGFECCTI